jgi:Uma2 family endonuclease
MSISTSLPARTRLIYPEDNGEPMAENTVQFRWIVTIKEGLEKVFRHRPDVFVAGDLLWYPVEGHPEISQAPDAMVVFGRPKGDRGSYLQWLEEGIAPHVVFEVLSPGNRPSKMIKKHRFYEQYGVQEYYIYDPEEWMLEGWQRAGESLREIENMKGWRSPLLDVSFDLYQGELRLLGPDGKRFLSYEELDLVKEQVERELDQIARERDRIARERDQMMLERESLARELEGEKERAERLAAQLKSLGADPSP